jgi:signal transduction histidine kinase
VRPRLVRSLVLAIAATVCIAGAGVAWERLRFGGDAQAGRERLRADVQHRLEDAAARLRAAADSIARDGSGVSAAIGDREALPELFARLADSRLPNAPPHALTVYVPDVTGAFQLLAWSDGPAEDVDIQAIAAAGPIQPSTIVLNSTMGLRLVALAPLFADDDRLIAVVTAERILTTGQTPNPDSRRYRLATALGDVDVAPASGTAVDRADRLVVSSREGRPLLEVQYDPAAIDAARRVFRGRVIALALIPVLVASLLLAVTTLARRRMQASVRRFLLLSGAMAVVIGAWALAGFGLTQQGELPRSVGYLVLGVGAMAIAWVLPVAMWWRGLPRRTARTQPMLAGLELLASGALATVILAGTGILIDAQWQSSGVNRLTSPLFPPNGPLLLAHAVRLTLALAAMWTVTSVHAAVVERWRIRWHDPGPALLAIVLGVLPTASFGLFAFWRADLTRVAPLALAFAVAAAIAALAAGPVRRRYRRASQSTRLLVLCAATVLPALILDPLGSLSSQRAIETLIERDYAPATLGHAERLLLELNLATAEIDAMDDLEALVTRPPGSTTISTDAAFSVWSGTGLSRARLTSAVELYGPDGALTSRFALNVPEYGTEPSSVDTACSWEVFGESGSFGAEELRMLHAERGVCDAAGNVRGAIVLHVIFDYRTLPYLSARNPYDDMRRAETDSLSATPAGIQVVVYGWGRLPVFVSGPTAWPIDADLLNRLEHSRDPFWTTRDTDAGTYRVYFLNDRAGIYALAYPLPSLFDHLTRLSETAALATILFIIVLAGATMTAPLVRQTRAPLRAVVAEVRTSFYRKLFLFFVLTAIIPVTVLALTFSAYMGGQLRSDVETEAINAVTVARRVLETTFQQVAPTDDVMVWIGRVINQDVNVYEGPRIRATSQRDLFDSGVLSERTPARAYRAITLDRVPTFVEEQRAGPLTYLVAATPVPGLSRQTVLSVPLAPRQQEIEREISDLNRGVLFGAVCVVLLAAGLGAWVAQRVADPVARLTRATRQIASGRLDVRIVADTADELRRLVTDFNSMAATLRDQRAELGRTHELKAWADMSRQVAHDVKNPLTPIQLAAEHLRRVHDDQGRPLGAVFDQCIDTILRQVKLLRQIASEFSSFAASPSPTLAAVHVPTLLNDVVEPYRAGLNAHTRINIDAPADLPAVTADAVLLARALTNLVENALQAMPGGGHLTLRARTDGRHLRIDCVDNGIGMSTEALARAFEPHFSTKTGGTGLGLANARRNVESCGGTLTAISEPGQGTTMRITLPVAPDATTGTA